MGLEALKTNNMDFDKLKANGFRIDTEGNNYIRLKSDIDKELKASIERFLKWNYAELCVKLNIQFNGYQVFTTNVNHFIEYIFNGGFYNKSFLFEHPHPNCPFLLYCIPIIMLPNIEKLMWVKDISDWAVANYSDKVRKIGNVLLHSNSLGIMPQTYSVEEWDMLESVIERLHEGGSNVEGFVNDYIAPFLSLEDLDRLVKLVDKIQGY